MLNDTLITKSVNSSMTLLDFIRYERDLSGTKIGCREGDCGACTVLIGELIDDNLIYRNVTSCLTPIGNVVNKHVVTIEGLNFDDGRLSPVQQNMVDEGGTQCGFCTVGFVVSMTGYCLSYPYLDQTILDSIDGNICRCTGYKSIERACNKVEKLLYQAEKDEWVTWLVDNGFVPKYFDGIRQRLANLKTTLKFDSDLGHRVAGGTDLYVQRLDELVQLDVSHLYYLNKNYIREDDGQIHVGANITATEFCNSPVILQYIPAMRDVMKLIASSPIRNISTIAGNIVNASPIADFANILLSLNASLELSSGRIVKLDQFYEGYKTYDLDASEVIYEITFPVPSGMYFNFEKVSKRTQLDIASVNSSICAEVGEDGQLKSCRISAGGVYPFPLLLKECSSYLVNKVVDEATVREALAIADREISPISDVRGSSSYKRLLLRQLLLAHVSNLRSDVVLNILEVSK